MFETKCFVTPEYLLEYRGRRLPLGKRHGLVMSLLFSVRGGRVSKITLANTIYQDENRASGRSDYNFAKVETTVRELDVLLENWPLSIERDDAMFYRLTERTTKHRAPGGL